MPLRRAPVPVWPRLARDITARVMMPMAPPVQAWMPALAGRSPKAAKPDQDEAERHEGVGDVQDQDEAVPPGALARPARQPNRLEHARGDQGRAGDAPVRSGNPGQERGAGGDHGDHVEACRTRPAGGRGSRARASCG